MYVVYNKTTGHEYDQYESYEYAQNAIDELNILEDFDIYLWRYEP